MKNLESYGVVEMTQQEMLVVEGGSWLSSAWDGIKSAAKWVAEHVTFGVIPSGYTC